MKKLLVFGSVALITVLVAALWALKVMGDFHQRDRSLTTEFEQQIEDLRALDDLFPDPSAATLNAPRFRPYLETRRAVSDTFRARIGETAHNRFHARETQNKLLRVLRVALQEHKMGLTEYRSIAARWRALLARPEFPALQKTWAAVVTTEEHKQGLPLPPPAKDATPAEIELIRKSAQDLEETMYADLFDPLLAGT